MDFKSLNEAKKISADEFMGFDAVGIAVNEGFDASSELAILGSAAPTASGVAQRERFNGSKGHLVVPLAIGKVKFVILYALGDAKKNEKKSRADMCRNAAFRIVREAASRGCESVALAIPEAPAHSRAIAEGATLAAYHFDKYKEKDKDDRFAAPKTVAVAGGNADDMRTGAVIASGQCYARDLANEPGNVINPATLADAARALAKELNLDCAVYEADKIKEMGMGALAAVGSGSMTPPRLIHLTMKPKGASKGKYVVIGKGLTFDSGGLSLKPADGMLTMKGDKTGACVALGTIRAAAMLALPIELHVVIGAAENMPGGSAYRPDDVLRAKNGKTIEVNNTDAEGRLTLADALCYASEMKPDAIIDIATLTGACAVALGEQTAGLFSNDDDFAESFLRVARDTGERFWRLPMDDDKLREQLKSPIADMVNTGSRYGGAITAAMFLEKFVGEDIPWIHLDIAATDYVKEPYAYYTKGATAYGERAIASWLVDKSNN